MRHLSKEALRSNGTHFFKTCFSETALTYGLLQVMKPSERCDPEHFDGGASLLHGGLTIFGSCHLECKVAASAAGEEASAAGEEAWRCSRNGQEVSTLGICVPPGIAYDTKSKRDLFAQPLEIHVTVMLRADVFRDERSRAKKIKPRPVEVFDIVNEAAASALSARPLSFPDFASCLAEHSPLA